MTHLRALAYARKHQDRFVGELKDFIRFPSVSNQPRHWEDLRKCARWLATHLRHIGFERVRIVPTKRHPIVYASWKHARGRPTVLIYGHYDVQPAEPLQAWKTPPFDPVVIAGDLYGRGSCDDKGQLFTHLKALESYLKTSGKLPVNVKCIFEGEEEMGGSPGLETFVAQNPSALRSDAAVVSDTRMLGPGRPALGYSQRGNLRFEVEVKGSHSDLHSGNFGGVIHNPVQALCEMLADLHDAEGRVTIPGFYDRVREWSANEREYMARVGPKDEDILRQAGVSKEWGETGYSLYERVTVRPALTFNGITGGYQGPRNQDDHSRTRFCKTQHSNRPRSGSAGDRTIVSRAFGSSRTSKSYGQRKDVGPLLSSAGQSKPSCNASEPLSHIARVSGQNRSFCAPEVRCRRRAYFKDISAFQPF